MQRRKFILGLGAASASGSALIGSGAFSSVAAERDIAIDVAGDSDAFLRLAPCTDDEGNEKPNGAYVDNTDGLLSISLSGDNDREDAPAGSGVNPEALSKFHNVFEICNQGTQEVCVNFGVDDDSDVPLIPDDAEIPDRYDFEAGEDPAVIFYESDSEEKVFPVDGSEPTDGFELETGECACFGFNVRAFGFDSGEDIFADTDLTIIADAEAECGVEEPEPCAIVNGEYVCTSYGDDVGDLKTAESSTFEFENIGAGTAEFGYALINDPDEESGVKAEIGPGESETVDVSAPNMHSGVVFWNGSGEECAETWGDIKDDLEQQLVDLAEDAGAEDDDFAQEIDIPEDVGNTFDDEFEGELDNIPEDDFPEVLDDFDVEPCDP